MLKSEEALLQELIDKYAKMYMKLAYNSGVPSENAEDVVTEAFWSFYKSGYFGCLSEKETKVMLANIVKNKSRSFRERTNLCKGPGRMDEGMGCYW